MKFHKTLLICLFLGLINACSGPRLVYDKGKITIPSSSGNFNLLSERILTDTNFFLSLSTNTNAIIAIERFSLQSTPAKSEKLTLGPLQIAGFILVLIGGLGFTRLGKVVFAGSYTSALLTTASGVGLVLFSTLTSREFAVIALVLVGIIIYLLAHRHGELKAKSM